MLAKNPAVMPVSSELVFWFQAHTEMPMSVKMSMGNSMRNRAPEMTRDTARSVMRNRRLAPSFPRGHSLTHKASTPKYPRAVRAICWVGTYWYPPATVTAVPKDWMSQGRMGWPLNCTTK